MWSFFFGKKHVSEDICGEWRTPQIVEIIKEEDTFKSSDGVYVFDVKKVVYEDDHNTVVRKITMKEEGGSFKATGTVDVRQTRIRWDNGAVWQKGCAELDEQILNRKAVIEEEATHDAPPPMFGQQDDGTSKDVALTHSLQPILLQEGKHEMFFGSCFSGLGTTSSEVIDVDLNKTEGTVLSEDQIDDVVTRCNDCLDIPLLTESMERKMLHAAVTEANIDLRTCLSGFCSNMWINFLELLLDEAQDPDLKKNAVKAILRQAIGDPLARALNGKINLPVIGEKTEGWLFRLLVNKILEEFVDITMSGMEDSGII